MEAEKEKKSDQFLPGTETEEQFDGVLAALSQWVKTNKVDIDVDLDGDIDISLAGEPEKLLISLSVKNLPVEDAVGIVEYEIPALLSAALSDDVKEWLVKTLPHKMLENIDATIERSKKVLKALGSEELKQRSLLRRTTDAYAVQDISCKQRTYHHRGKNKEKVDIPHVTLEITFAKPRSKMMLALDPTRRTMFPRRTEEVTVALDLHKGDFKKLVKELEKTLESIDE